MTDWRRGNAEPPPEDLIVSALGVLDADDRETWIAMGMAVQDALGDEGFAVWDEWSRGSERYRESDARAAWRSFRPGGGVSVGTLFAAAKREGWNPGLLAPPLKRLHQQQPRRPSQTTDNKPPLADVKRKIRRRLERAVSRDEHPYLVRKGFPKQPMHVDPDSGALLIPMAGSLRPSWSPNAVQEIYPDGRKRFWPTGCSVSGSRFPMVGGASHIINTRTWECEGYATALSIRAALKRIGRACDHVVVHFTAGNLGRYRGARYATVIADHDWWHCGAGHKWDHEPKDGRCPTCGKKASPPAGQRAALRTRLPWWQPPEPGMDANDFHQAFGIDALADVLLEIVAGRPIIGPMPLQRGAALPDATGQSALPWDQFTVTA